MEDILYADGFEDAVIGIGQRFNYEVAIYSSEKCIDILMERDGMTRDEAVEYMDFNVLGSYMGEHTPVFMINEDIWW